MPLKFEDLDTETRKRIQGLLNMQEGQRKEDGARVVGSHPAQCPQGHSAAIMVWSDGTVELVCPTCGRRGLSEGEEVRASQEIQPSASRRQESGLLEDTKPLPAMEEISAALEETRPLNLPSAKGGKEKSQPEPSEEKERLRARYSAWGLAPLGAWLVLLVAFYVGAFIARNGMAWRSQAITPQARQAYTALVRPESAQVPQQVRPQLPALQIYSPVENARLHSSTLAVNGRTEPGTAIRLKTAWAGEVPLTPDHAGNFSYSLALPLQPVKEISIIATNGGGSTTKTIHLDDPAVQIPQTYYQVTSPYGHYQNTSADLNSFLNRFRLPRKYEKNIFDCSDSSAMLQWALTISGFKASIVTGPCPWDKNLGEHAWVIVHTIDHTVAVEATALTKRGFLQELFSWSTPGVIYSNNPYAANYYGGYTKEFPDIYAAVRAYGSAKEWEWWAGEWGFK
ncbi:hypothetical protein SDD30_15990 [Moorella naiadis]|uniref:hypothetical protein n=1 Tax=Moorella naiadis (nom. illeg.) TaxID=3093670 RepID=UPI003D9C9704